MRTLLLVLLTVIGLSAMAQEYRSRLPTAAEQRRVAGLKNFAQAEFERANRPYFIDGWLYQSLTNDYDGIVYVRSNATVLVHVVLPNPTNNLYRTFEITTMDACTARLSNVVTGTFTDALKLTNGNNYFVASNKTVVVRSTGTNWIVRQY